MRRVFMLTLSLCVVILALAAARPVAAQGGGVNLLSGLVSYWDMDEASGTRYDSHSDNDLTDNNTVGVTTTAVLGNAASFVAANSESLTSSHSFDESEFSISLWVLLDGSEDFFMSQYQLSGNQRSWYVKVDTENRVRFVTSADGTVENCSSLLSNPIAGTGMHHIAVWYDGSVKGLQINNGDVYTQSRTIYDSSTTLNIGFVEASSYSDSAIDEVGFWNRALNADERAALYNDGAGLAYSEFDEVGVYASRASVSYGGSNLRDGLEAYWKMNELDGTRHDTLGNYDMENVGGYLDGIPGKIGYATEFNVFGVGGDLQNDLVNINAQSFTFSFWWANPQGEGLYVIPLQKFDLYSYTLHVLVDVDVPAGPVEFKIWDRAGNSDIIESNETINPYMWYFISVWYDYAAGRFGVQVNDDIHEATTDIVPYDNYHMLHWGNSTLGPRYLVDEAGMWNRALSDAERLQLYNDGDGLPYSDFETEPWVGRATWTPHPTATPAGICRSDDACPTGIICLSGEVWACQGTAPTNTPAPTLRPTLTATPTPTPEPTSSPIPTPTATLSPTATLTPIPTLTLIPSEWITVPIEGNSRYQYAHTGIEGVLPSFANGFNTPGEGWLYWAGVTVDSVNQGNLLFVIGGILLAMLILGWIIDQVKNPRI